MIREVIGNNVEKDSRKHCWMIQKNWHVKKAQIFNVDICQKYVKTSPNFISRLSIIQNNISLKAIRQSWLSLWT